MSREVHAGFCERREVRLLPATHLVVMCKTRRQAENALATLASMGLETKPVKTRITHLAEDGEGLDFLGFHHRWVRSRDQRFRHVCFLARWPSRQAMQRGRERVRELTARDRLRWPVEQVMQDVNRFLRGWAGYFRYQRAWWYGRKLLNSRPDRYGLISLNGTIVAPRPNRPRRTGR